MFNFWLQNKGILIATTTVFLLGCLAGVLKPSVHLFISDYGGELGFQKILTSNSIVVLSIIFIGIWVIVSLFANGYVFGSALSVVISKDSVAFFKFLAPHGLFEIPVLLLAGSLALKIVSIFIVLIKGGTLNRKDENILMKSIILLITLLMLAAVIESLIATTLT